MVHGGYELKPLGKWSSVSSNIGKKHWEKVKRKTFEQTSWVFQTLWKPMEEASTVLTFIDGTSLVCLGHSGIMSFS
jgi:hypothetical protein